MQYKYLVNIALAIGLSVASSATLAFSYGKMHVQISNNTADNCQLINQKLRHGKFDSAPPQTILANDSKTFDMNESTISFFGPDVVLFYQCGAGKIQFEVQQNSSIAWGHTPKVTVLSSSSMNLTSNNQSSSLPYNARGIANITLQAN